MTTFSQNVPAYGPVENTSFFRRTSWGAIIAGAVVALSVQLLLVVFGAAIGISVWAASQTETAAQGVGIGAAIWWILATIIALFCGGFVAATLMGSYRRNDGVLHGAVTWGLVTIISVITLGTLIGGAFSVMAQTGQAAIASGQVRPGDVNAATDGNVAANAPAAAREAAGPTAGAAWGLFLMLLLGLGAAIFGGAVGTASRREESGVVGKTIDTEHRDRPGLAA